MLSKYMFLLTVFIVQTTAFAVNLPTSIDAQKLRSESCTHEFSAQVVETQGVVNIYYFCRTRRGKLLQLGSWESGQRYRRGLRTEVNDGVINVIVFDGSELLECGRVTGRRFESCYVWAYYSGLQQELILVINN